jgi:hypothetical protein
MRKRSSFPETSCATLFPNRSNQTIYYARVMDSRPPDANAMMEYASLRLLAGDSAGYKRLCARLVERYGDTSDLGIVDNLAVLPSKLKTCHHISSRHSYRRLRNSRRFFPSIRA